MRGSSAVKRRSGNYTSKYQSDKMHVASTQVGHALVVGNPLPTRARSLREAEAAAEFVSELLGNVGFEVHALMRQGATKAEVQSKIMGAKCQEFVHLLHQRCCAPIVQAPKGHDCGGSARKEEASREAPLTSRRTAV